MGCPWEQIRDERAARDIPVKPVSPNRRRSPDRMPHSLQAPTESKKPTYNTDRFKVNIAPFDSLSRASWCLRCATPPLKTAERTKLSANGGKLQRNAVDRASIPVRNHSIGSNLRIPRREPRPTASERVSRAPHAERSGCMRRDEAASKGKYRITRRTRYEVNPPFSRQNRWT